MSTHTVTATLHLPNNYKLPETGSTDIKVRNITDRATPFTHHVWGADRLPAESPWRFTFNIDSSVTEVGDTFAINVNMAHEGAALLLDIEHTFRWGGGDQEVNIDLSPVGYIAIKKAFMPRIGYPHDSKLIVKLIEKTTDGGPEVVLGEAVGLTADTRPVYLRYDPLVIKPGQRYALTGSFETLNRTLMTLGLKPNELVLMPEKVQTLSFGA
ncbi:hypothetical protein [Pseudomonas purpurea]|uniref:hypothetical protein n=1 Tax=Pseudomonas purpurea TaxID=3136737 RepID=UPI003265B5AF